MADNRHIQSHTQDETKGALRIPDSVYGRLVFSQDHAPKNASRTLPPDAQSSILSLNTVCPYYTMFPLAFPRTLVLFLVTVLTAMLAACIAALAGAITPADWTLLWIAGCLVIAGAVAGALITRAIVLLLELRRMRRRSIRPVLAGGAGRGLSH